MGQAERPYGPSTATRASPPPLVVVGVGGTKNGLPMRFSAPRILRLAPSLPHGLRNGGAPCIDRGLKQRRAAAAPPDALYGPERGRGDSRHPLLRRLPHPRGADHLVERSPRRGRSCCPLNARASGWESRRRRKMQKRSRRIDERSKKGYVLIVPTGRREVPVRGSRPMLQSGRR